ncbi:amidohydrolase family protein [Variovorax sp. J22P271]|uniref:amidohydrolase family protein n=1 Tax=Variovorax davisae TaxID=3053515 RepID=UPI002578D3E6|nr:amidohydrolase family protein [Variovorax sp. J22P271]MDM0033763.1 amidohydrolase family protein [Variovorax sp. J22P271]
MINCSNGTPRSLLGSGGWRALCGHLACNPRRGFLKSMGALGAAALLPSTAALAQAPAAGSGRIDFHHHFFSPAWVRLVESKNAAKPVLGFEQFKSHTIAKDIEAMDKGNVEKAFLSVTQPGVWFGNVEETRGAARELNEFATRQKSDYKGRFGHFAVLPLPDVDASLREIEYAFDTLKADGVGLLSSYDDQWLGDKAFAPVWAELNRRKAVVYIHATAHNCCSWDFQPGVLPTFVELGSDLARAMVSLIQSGTAKATPDVRYIWSHGGGSIWAQRFLVGETAESLAREAPADSRLHHFRRFFYDTAAAADAIHMGILKLIVPPSQIVFGSDYPWVEPARIAAGLQASGLSAQQLQAIYRDNAFKLMPELRQPTLQADPKTT